MERKRVGGRDEFFFSPSLSLLPSLLTLDQVRWRLELMTSCRACRRVGGEGWRGSGVRGRGRRRQWAGGAAADRFAPTMAGRWAKRGRATPSIPGGGGGQARRAAPISGRLMHRTGRQAPPRPAPAEGSEAAGRGSGAGAGGRSVEARWARRARPRPPALPTRTPQHAQIFHLVIWRVQSTKTHLQGRPRLADVDELVRALERILRLGEAGPAPVEAGHDGGREGAGRRGEDGVVACVCGWVWLCARAGAGGTAVGLWPRRARRVESGKDAPPSLRREKKKTCQCLASRSGRPGPPGTLCHARRRQLGRRPCRQSS